MMALVENKIAPIRVIKKPANVILVFCFGSFIITEAPVKQCCITRAVEC